ncbi:MAG: hypothetical protein JXA97_12025, partial [Anaerolineales bacterium]|nr:hypothetical protein [Anaerolineales bacterium]
QLHKGGRKEGLFLVITVEPVRDVALLEENFSFGDLLQAQAIGDLQALQAAGRRAYSIYLGIPADYRTLAEALEAAIEAA